MAPKPRSALRKSARGSARRKPAARVAPGWTALTQGRWEAARSAFADALEQEETPESLEGLSWAAWWLDDADTVFDARERACRLYRRRGDAASAARMATWLAADHLDFRGAFAVANGWLQRARRLLQRVEPRADHGWLAFHEGYIAFIQGDTVRSSELARYTSELGLRFDAPDLEMLGLALEGAVLVACGKVQDGMRCLDEATAAALDTDANIPISRAWACCFLVTACEGVRDYRRAFEWCDRIAEFVERYGSRYMLGFCRQHYAAVHMWRGQWQEAEAHSRPPSTPTPDHGPHTSVEYSPGLPSCAEDRADGRKPSGCSIKRVTALCSSAVRGCRAIAARPSGPSSWRSARCARLQNRSSFNVLQRSKH
jgi:tetratricopeptide (TPR) repeat protein